MVAIFDEYTYLDLDLDLSVLTDKEESHPIVQSFYGGKGGYVKQIATKGIFTGF